MIKNCILILFDVTHLSDLLIVKDPNNLLVTSLRKRPISITKLRLTVPELTHCVEDAWISDPICEYDDGGDGDPCKQINVNYFK